MVKIPETHTPSSISLGRNTPDSLNAVGSKINNPFADAIDTLGAGLNMFGKTLDREQKVKAAEDEKQRVAKLKAAEDAHKQELASQLAEFNMVLSNRISDFRAEQDGKEIRPDTILQLSQQVYEKAFDSKRAGSIGLSGPLSADLREKAREITFNVSRSAYNETQKNNIILRAKQTTEKNELADKAIVRDISLGIIDFNSIQGTLEARRIARSESNEPEEITAETSFALLRDGLKGLVLNKTEDLPTMKGLLGGYATFVDPRDTKQTLTYRQIVGDKDYLSTKKAYQSNLENKIAQAALNSPEIDIRKMLYVDGMYDNQSELDAANKRVLENKTALEVQRQQILDEQNRVEFTAAILDENHSSMYAKQVAIDRANAEKANNLQTASEEKWKKELKDIPWYDFSGKKKERLNDALFNSEKQKGKAEIFSQTVIWNGEPFDYLRLTNSDAFKNAGGSQKFLLEDMQRKAKYDRAKQMLPAGIDVEALIDKAVKSLDPKGLYGKDYLQPDIRWELATTLSGVAPNKKDVENLINQTAAKVYGRNVFKDEKQKTDYDSLVDIIRTAKANRKTNQTNDDVFMSIRNELNDKYDSDIVDKMMPYIISGQYVKAIGVPYAFKSR